MLEICACVHVYVCAACCVKGMPGPGLLGGWRCSVLVYGPSWLAADGSRVASRQQTSACLTQTYVCRYTQAAKRAKEKRKYWGRSSLSRTGRHIGIGIQIQAVSSL